MLIIVKSSKNKVYILIILYKYKKWYETIIFTSKRNCVENMLMMLNRINKVALSMTKLIANEQMCSFLMHLHSSRFYHASNKALCALPYD